MSEHTASIMIKRPVEDVFAFLSDPQNRLKYDSDLIEVRQNGESPIEIGMQIVEVRRMGGRKIELTTEVIGLEVNRQISYQSQPGDPSNAFGTYTFEAVSEGTRLSLDFTTKPRGFFRLIAPLISSGLNRSIPKGLENIKKVLESE